MKTIRILFATVLTILTVCLGVSGCKSKEEIKTPDKIDVKGVTINPKTLTLRVGETSSLSAAVEPANATNKNVSYLSSNAMVVSVEKSSGKITAVKAGKATVTVITEDWGKKDDCEVTVEESAPGTVSVTGVRLDQNELTLEEGENAALAATVEPADATNKKISWKSSDDKVVTVDQNGKLSAVKAGTATVTVTTEDGSRTDGCKVTVKAKQPEIIEVESISVSIKNGKVLEQGETVTLEEGSTAELVVTINPDNATDKTFEIKSDSPAVLGIENCVMTAKSAGTSGIKVTAQNGKSFSFKVEVHEKEAEVVPVTSVVLNKYKIDLHVGESETLVATVNPDNATNKKVKWSSKRPEIATVDQNGKVTAVAPGDAPVGVTTEDGEFKQYCQVHVINDNPGGDPAEEPEPEPDKYSLYCEDAEVGSSYSYSLGTNVNDAVYFRLYKNGKPVKDQNYGNFTISTSGGSAVSVSVSATGYGSDTHYIYKVIANDEGYTKITFTYNDEFVKTISFQAVKTIKHVTGVSLNYKTWSDFEATKGILKAIVTPSDATNKSVTWSSSDKDIVSVDANGNLSLIAPGKATITVKSDDGGYTSTCEVTVKEYYVLSMDKPSDHSFELHHNNTAAYDVNVFEGTTPYPEDGSWPGYYYTSVTRQSGGSVVGIKSVTNLTSGISVNVRTNGKKLLFNFPKEGKMTLKLSVQLENNDVIYRTILFSANKNRCFGLQYDDNRTVLMEKDGTYKISRTGSNITNLPSDLFNIKVRSGKNNSTFIITSPTQLSFHNFNEDIVKVEIKYYDNTYVFQVKALKKGTAHLYLSYKIEALNLYLPVDIEVID